MADILYNRHPTQYLPPAGVYYDQLDLEKLFGYNYFHVSRCWTCFSPGCSATTPQDCDAPCGVCGYVEIHTGRICPMLYCSHTWLTDRSVPTGFRNATQLRPGLGQAGALEAQGMLHHMIHYKHDVVPRMESNAVKKFYNHYGVGPIGRLRRRAPVIWTVNIIDGGHYITALVAPTPTVASDLTIDYICGLLGPEEVTHLKQEVDIIQHLSLEGAAVTLHHLGADLLMSIPAIRAIVQNRYIKTNRSSIAKEEPSDSQAPTDGAHWIQQSLVLAPTRHRLHHQGYELPPEQSSQMPAPEALAAAVAGTEMQQITTRFRGEELTVGRGELLVNLVSPSSNREDSPREDGRRSQDKRRGVDEIPQAIAADAAQLDQQRLTGPRAQDSNSSAALTGMSQSSRAERWNTDQTSVVPHTQLIQYYQELLKSAEQQRLQAVSKLRIFQAAQGLIPNIPDQRPSHPELASVSSLSELQILKSLEQHMLSSEERRVAAEQALIALKLRSR